MEIETQYNHYINSRYHLLKLWKPNSTQNLERKTAQKLNSVKKTELVYPWSAFNPSEEILINNWHLEYSFWSILLFYILCNKQKRRKIYQHLLSITKVSSRKKIRDDQVAKIFFPKFPLKTQHENQNNISHTFITLILLQLLSFASTKLPRSHKVHFFFLNPFRFCSALIAGHFLLYLA